MLFVAFGLLGVNEKAWAYWTGSGEGTKKNGVWYVLYEDGAQTANNWGGTKEYSLSGPGKTLTFEGKNNCISKYTTTDVSVEDDKGTSLWSGTVKNSYAGKTATNNCNIDATKIIFKNAIITAYTFSMQKVHVTMAQYIEDPSPATSTSSRLSCGTADYNSNATSGQVTVPWCNVPAMSYVIENDANNLFSVSVANNSEAGKYNTATFTVSYQHTKAGTHTATLKITDTYGSYSKTVYLTGTTNKGTPTIDCSQVSASTLTYGQKLSASTISGPNASYKGGSYAGTYSWKRSDASTHVAQGCTNYVVKFTPTNTNLTSVECTIQVPITKVAQTITWSPAKDYLVDEDIQLSASTIGDASVYFESANTDVAVIDGNWLRMVGAGDVVIKARANATCNYSAAADVEHTFKFRHRPTITWTKTGENDHIYGGDTLVKLARTSYGTTDLNLPLTYSADPANLVYIPTTLDSVIVKASNEEHTCTITASFAGNDTYCAASSTHAYNLEPRITARFYMTGHRIMGNDTTLHLLIGQTANMSFEEVDEARFSYTENPQYVSYTHNSANHTGVLTALKYGDEGLHFQQGGSDTHFAVGRNVHVFVHKHEVTLTTTLNGGTWKVDSVYTGAVYGVNAPEAGEPAQNAVTVTSSDEKVLKYVDGGWKAVGAGTAILTIAQPNNDYWTGDTIEASITVEKYTPVITWNLESTYPWGSQIMIPVSSSNEELPFTVTSSDPSKADYVNGQIEVYNINGNVTFTLSQPGNYKWADATNNNTFTFNCFKPANHLPFLLASSNYSHYKSSVSSTNDVSWSNNGVQCGTTGGGFNWDDKYIDLHFTGIPNRLTFDYQTNNNVIGNHSGVEWYVQFKTETGNWGDKTTWDGNSGSKNFQLNPDIRYVRLCYSGNYGGLFTNIRVTERKEIVAPASVTFPTNSVDASANTQTINVDWYNVKHSTVTITATNASFFHLADDSHEIASTIDDYGTQALKVSYAYPEGGTHTATLHIESEDGKTADVALQAASDKLTPAITWKENLTPMSRGENVENPASSPVTLVYESSDPTVVDVEGNTLKPLKKGTATITAAFDGSADKKYNSNSSTIDVLVTDMKVLHINWPQTFTRLRYSAEKPGKTTADFELNATVSYFDPDTKEEISIDRTVTFTSGDDNVVQVKPGNILHVVGEGTTTLTAHVDGIENEYLEANVIRSVKVREPSTDCDTYILEDAHNSMLTEINSFNGVETVYDLNEEPGYLTFSAWTEKWYLGKIGIDPSGDMKVAQYIDGDWSEAIWSNSLQIGVEQPFGPIALDRRATKIKFYKEVGSTCYHNFSEGYITLARYVELENTAGKTTHNIDFTTEETKPGVKVVKTFTVNYSNITDQLQVDLAGSDKFTILSSTTIGEACGDKGTATVQVQFLSDDVDHYEGTITIHNENQSVTINLSADVDKHAQQITWEPETTNLKTTDDVTFDATTSGAAAGLSVRYEVTEGSDVATVDANSGALTIIKGGDVTVQANADGDGTTYYDAEPKSYTFHISKVTPSVTVVPTAATMTLPNTSLADCALTGGEASVEGTFAWADATIDATLNNEGYTVVFTPDNTNWYNTTTCTVVVPIHKQINVITWNFDVTEMYCNADYTFDATATSGLDVYYETSDASIAYVDDAKHLQIIKGGEVTITAHEDGNENWAAAEPVAKTLTIKRFAPEIVAYPSAAPMKIGRLLSDATLTGGRAELDNGEVEGSFAWVDGNTTTMSVAGTFSKQIVFNPSNENYYEPVYAMMDVKVEKYAPEIAHTLQGSDITYGQPLSASNLSGDLTATDIVKLPHETVSGTYAWRNADEIVNAGTPTMATVRFTPDNTDWYDVVDFEVPVNVAKAAPVLNVTASEIAIGQTLSQSILTNNGTPGTCAWDPSLNAATTVYSVEGDYTGLPFVFTSSDPNYANATGVVTLHVNVGFVFNGTDGDWNKDTNWQNGDKPGTTDNVLVNADVEIDGPVTVGSLTIAENADVIVKNGGSLTIEGSSLNRPTYGNIHVENGGNLNLTGGTLSVKNFILDAQLGSTVEDVTSPSASGQVQGADKLNINGDAYFQLAVDPSGRNTYGWYDFVVPFEVEVIGGITIAEAPNTPMQFNVNYAVMSYDESKRAVNGKDWNKFTGTMEPGRVYTITLDETQNWNTVVFKKKQGAPVAGDRSFTTSFSGLGETVDNGWNGFGNGSLQHMELDVPEGTLVQVYDHANKCYRPREAKDMSIAVGLSFFMQVDGVQTIELSPAAGNTHFLAPKRVREHTNIDKFRLALTAEGAANASDNLWVSASEDATGDYVIGRDVLKMGTMTSSKVARMWSSRNNMDLCSNEMQMVNDKAECKLNLYAPNAGSYTLGIENAPENATLYLTYNGRAIWALSASPYLLDLEAGTTEGYGLRVVAAKQAPAVTTGVDAAEKEDIRGRKVIIDNVLYIITPEGAMYDLLGKSVKF